MRTSTSLVPSSSITLPKLIHFIWAGGMRLMPDNGLATLLAWAEQNPDFTIWLWVDSCTAPYTGRRSEKLAQFAKAYWEQMSRVRPDLKSVLHVWAQTPPSKNRHGRIANIVIKDVVGERLVNRHIRHEIDRLQPNYGSSSDILRYRILFRYGGAYFDPDVGPADKQKVHHAKALTELDYFDIKLKQHILWLEHVTQIPTHLAKLNQLKNFEIKPDGLIGNDSFISTKENPLMALLYKEALRNYHLGVLEQKISKKDFAGFEKDYSLHDSLLIKMGYGARDREFYALNLTGPYHVRNTLLSPKVKLTKNHEEYWVRIEKLPPVQLKPLRNAHYSLVAPMKNTLNWLRVFVTPVPNPEAAMQRALSAIEFEVKHFTVLRLDDHIDDLVRSLPEQVNKKNVVKKFIKRLNRAALPWKKVQIAQVLFDYPEVAALYRKKGLWQKTFVASQTTQLPMVLEYATAHDWCERILHEHAPLKVLQKEYTEKQRLELLRFMHKGIVFMRGLMVNGMLNLQQSLRRACRKILRSYHRLLNYLPACLPQHQRNCQTLLHELTVFEQRLSHIR